ncbi:MAG: MFS transporter [Elusimicrobia bacterium]|nr:MFS transporter [Elusimicrobiota bacterium]
MTNAVPANGAGSPPGSRLAFALRALKVRNYRLFFSGQMVSLIGTWMQTVAQSWLVYRLTGSALLLGTVGFCTQFPVFLIAAVGGAVADRHNRHRIVVATQTASMLQAAVLAALTLTGRIQVWHVFCLAASLGLINAFDIPARQSLIADLVEKKDLINAIALNSSMFNSARIIGPAVAGVLVGTLGEGWCFFANAVSFLAVIAGLLMMDFTPRPIPARTSGTLEHMLEGFRFVRRTAPVLAVLLLLGMASLVGMPYMVLMPIFADRILHGGARGLGLLMSSTGVGALLGALSLALRSGTRGLMRVVAAHSAAFGVSLILFSASRHFWLSAALLLPVGFTLMVQMAASNTLIQSMVPDHLRGRVMAVYSMMFMGMAPFGSLYAGAFAHWAGAPSTVALGGVVCIAGASMFAARLTTLHPEVRRLIDIQDPGGASLPAPAPPSV